MPLIDIRAFTTVEIDRNRMGGMPVLKGTRFPAAQLLAELTEAIEDICEDFDLDLELVTNFLDELANQFDPKFNESLREYLKELKSSDGQALLPTRGSR